MTEQKIIRTEKLALGDGYELHFEWALTFDWFTSNVYAPVATTLEEGALVRIAERSVRKNQVREVRWAKRMKKRHMQARELAL